MGDLNKRDELFNAVLDTVKKHGIGMEIGSVRAVLAEVDGEITCRVGRKDFDIVCEQLRKRQPRE